MLRSINAAGLALIRHFEGTVLTVYLDAASQPTVGTGHLVRSEDRLEPGDVISEAQADAFLQADLARAAAAVDNDCPRNLTANNRGALVSLCYNIGGEAFGNSTLVRLLREGEVSAAAEQFQRWDKAGGRALTGLLARRLTERDLFLTPDESPMPDGWLSKWQIALAHGGADSSPVNPEHKPAGTV